MKIEISKEEYLDLLDLLHIASWVLFFHKTKVEPDIAKYDPIIQRFYAMAGEMGLRDIIEYDPGKGHYRPTKAFEDASPSLKFIDDFVDHSFWDELIIRFAERDAARQAGGYEQLDRLGHEDRHVLLDPIEERYAGEFNNNGIEHLEIVEHFGRNTTVPVRTHD